MLNKLIVQAEIANVTARAFHIAESGIPGPVVIAIPTDILEATSRN